MLRLLTTGSYPLFLVSAFLGSMAMLTTYQSTLVIALEITSGKEAASIAMLQNIGWAIGNSLMPLLMWAVGDWTYFLLITTLPSALFLLPSRLVSQLCARKLPLNITYNVHV